MKGLRLVPSPDNVSESLLEISPVYEGIKTRYKPPYRQILFLLEISPVYEGIKTR